MMDKITSIQNTNRNAELNLNPANNLPSVIEASSVIHTESDLPNIGGDLDAFLPFCKVGKRW